MTEEEFNNAVSKVFKIELSNTTKIYFEYTFNENTFRLKRKRFREAVSKLKTFKTEENFEIFDEKHFEVSVIQSTRFFYPGDDEIFKDDTVNKIKYNLSSSSDAYLVLLLKQMLLITTDVNLSRPFFFHRLRNRRFQNGENETNDLFDVLKQVIPRFQTLKITSESNKSRQEFETLCYSFLFNLSYNTDLSYLPSSITDDLTRSIRIGRLRRAKIEEIDVPKRRYENDLILFCQKGISSESVDLQYLSFYHILEHFFEKIYNDELIKSIKTELTKPSFSYKRTKDVSELIKVIQDKLRYKNEEFQINEPEALRLVLDRFVPDFDEVKEEIKSYDTNLLDYYKSTEVEFSKGNKVNFSEERDKILKNLRERVYKTRNSIVHSKETDREKYLPFKHDKILQKEIILMRIIAEKIIIESSREL
ncbi:hypothetical protein [Flavobacterium sp. SM2513]|uniref:hypothetical protein n=1 Tax=Flavobacterium sp. SM2513 TaxID=3424766 RepID=UPI003D7FBD52